jgi:hypothetical protein
MVFEKSGVEYERVVVIGVRDFITPDFCDGLLEFVHLLLYNMPLYIFWFWDRLFGQKKVGSLFDSPMLCVIQYRRIIGQRPWRNV